jgi:hypothetical protein
VGGESDGGACGGAEGRDAEIECEVTDVSRPRPSGLCGLVPS